MQLGHQVSEDKIISRYNNSLDLLKKAIQLSNRAFIWDNSNEAANLFGEITEGVDVEIFDNQKVPSWFTERFGR